LKSNIVTSLKEGKKIVSLAGNLFSYAWKAWRIVCDLQCWFVSWTWILSNDTFLEGMSHLS